MLELQAQAVTRGLADAGLTLADVDGLATNSIGRFSATQLADQLRHPAGLGRLHLRRRVGVRDVRRPRGAGDRGRAGLGRGDVVRVATSARRAPARSAGCCEDHLPEAQFETPYAPLYPLSYYAMAAQAYLHRYGLTREHLAQVAVSAREWALLNPVAFQHDAGPLTVAEVLRLGHGRPHR